MACPQPFYIKNRYYSTHSNGTKRYWQKYLEIPCGWCLNCRVDRQNYYIDRAWYEYDKFGYGAFVCLTFDDWHIAPFCITDPNTNSLVIDNYTHRPLMSIPHEEASKFIERLRRYMKYHNFDLPGFTYKFKWLGCYEYGGQFDRPHFHFCFFGLDYKKAVKVFQKCWPFGFVDSRPILRGGIEYVTKYLDKECHGLALKEKYDDRNLVRPWIRTSNNFGVGLYLDNLDYIRNHKLCYLSRKGKLRPLPAYYRNKFFPYDSDSYNSVVVSEMKANGVRRQDPSIYGRYGGYTIKDIKQYRHTKAGNILSSRIIQSRKHGNPVDVEYSERLPHFDYIKIMDSARYSDTVPF